MGEVQGHRTTVNGLQVDSQRPLKRQLTIKPCDSAKDLRGGAVGGAGECMPGLHLGQGLQQLRLEDAGVMEGPQKLGLHVCHLLRLASQLGRRRLHLQLHWLLLVLPVLRVRSVLPLSQHRCCRLL